MRLLSVITLSGLLLTACGGGGGGSSSAPPTQSSSAINDAASLDEDASVEINVTANDTNVSASSVQIASGPSHGSVSVSSNGLVSYIPDADYYGTDNFTYQVTSNNNTGSSSATVSITINPVNDAPVAVTDSTSTLINTPVVIDVLANDSDVDSSLANDGITINSSPLHGDISFSSIADELIYTPTGGFTGNDSFTYRVTDSDGAESNAALVTITVFDLDDTNLVVSDLAIPTAGYTEAFSTELDQTVLQSEPLAFSIPPNTVSFAVHLMGDSVYANNGQLHISELMTPDGLLITPLFRTAEFCDLGYCGLLVPKRPDIAATPGTWELRLAFADPQIDPGTLDASLRLVTRVGPAPDFSAATGVTLAINTVITGSLVDTDELNLILASVADLFEQNSIKIFFDTVTRLDTVEFAEVGRDFDAPATAKLITTYADPTKANLFILDSFNGPGGAGLLGITGGIPASLGVQSQYNGVLINGTVFQSQSSERYRDNTAQVIVHELGHYLGLHHTTEARYNSTDVLDDTPECLKDSHDSNSDGYADEAECPDGMNLMFWENTFRNAKTQFSSDQQQVMQATPVGTK